MVTIQPRQRPPAGKVSDDAMRRRETSVVDEYQSMFVGHGPIPLSYLDLSDRHQGYSSHITREYDAKISINQLSDKERCRMFDGRTATS
jgi:hypothetical protein